MQLTLPVVTAAAMLDSLNPCAVSVLLVTLGFLISLNATRKKILVIAGLYVLGIFLTYLLIGFGVLGALSVFGIPKAISKIGAGILVITSLINLASEFFPGFPIKLTIPAFIKPGIAAQMYRASLVSALIMGIIVGLFEFPCTGGPYLMILGLLHDRSTLNLGAAYLIYYNLIFVAPLIALVLIGSAPGLTDKIAALKKQHSRTVSIVIGLATLLLGSIIFII